MKSHRLDETELADRQLKETKADVMPYDVATDLLCSLERMTNTTRKAYQGARQRIFVSTSLRIPAEARLARKLADKSLQQLGKWNRRAKIRRRGLQRKYEKAQAMEMPPVVKDRLLAGLDLAAAGCDLVIEATQAQVENRIENLSHFFHINASERAYYRYALP